MAIDSDENRRVLRVLMIAPTSFFGDYGCHVRILEEARALQRLGHRVTIVTYRNGRDVPGLDIRRTLLSHGDNSMKSGQVDIKLDLMLCSA